MPTFPTLTTKPIFPVPQEKEDSVIKSGKEGGYLQTRQRYTRIRKNFQVQYHNLSTTEMGTLDTFENTVKGGADSFTWTHPMTGVVYSVRLDGTIKFSPTHDNRWDAEFTLDEV